MSSSPTHGIPAYEHAHVCTHEQEHVEHACVQRHLVCVCGVRCVYVVDMCMVSGARGLGVGGGVSGKSPAKATLRFLLALYS